jgi:hypothetical protein
MLPSVKTLAEVFGDRARDARRILEMTRAELVELPTGAARVRECYHAPRTSDIRLRCLDAICDSTYGVEAFELTHGKYRGTWLEYLNAGDPYVATLVRVGGRYRVADWGDYAERYTRA